MDKNINSIKLDTELEENDEDCITIIESYRCRTSPYNHQGRNSLNSSNTCPITPPLKPDLRPQINNYKKNSNNDLKNSIEKTKSDPNLINNLNECIESLKKMLLNKKSSKNISHDFSLYDESMDYDLSDISSLDLNEENV